MNVDIDQWPATSEHQSTKAEQAPHWQCPSHCSRFQRRRQVFAHRGAPVRICSKSVEKKWRRSRPPVHRHKVQHDQQQPQQVAGYVTSAVCSERHRIAYFVLMVPLRIDSFTERPAITSKVGPHSLANRHSCLTYRAINIESAGPTIEGTIHQRMIFVFISERDTFAICYRRSVCLSSVTLVHPTQPVEIFGNFSSPFGTLAIHWYPLKILRRSSQGNPSVGGFKRKRGIQNSDFSPLECCISETVQDRRYRKSYMGFRLIPKSVTLNYYYV